MIELFNVIIFRPLLNALVVLYGLVGNELGLAIVVMTVIIKGVSLPLSLKTLRSQRDMAALAPELERIKEKHKGNKETQGQAMMELYKKNNINPLAGCLPLLIQIPVLLGLYRVFLNVFKPESLDALYSFVPNPGTIETMTLGLLDLGQRSIILAITAGAMQFIHAKYAQPKEQVGQAAMIGKQMLYFFPLMIIVISWNLPAGLALYWVISTLMSIGEQWYSKHSHHGRISA